jgi:hypothetical protein
VSAPHTLQFPTSWGLPNWVAKSRWLVQADASLPRSFASQSNTADQLRSSNARAGFVSCIRLLGGALPLSALV